MPSWMSKKQIQLDETIEQRTIVILTNEGPHKAKVVQYHADLDLHTIQFDVEVSILDDILRKKVWKVNLPDLAHQGSLNMKQFLVNDVCI